MKKVVENNYKKILKNLKLRKLMSLKYLVCIGLNWQ